MFRSNKVLHSNCDLMIRTKYSKAREKWEWAENLKIMRWDQTKNIRNEEVLVNLIRSTFASHCYGSIKCFRLNYRCLTLFLSLLFIFRLTHTYYYEPAFVSHQSQIYMWFMHVNRFTIFFSTWMHTVLLHHLRTRARTHTRRIHSSIPIISDLEFSNVFFTFNIKIWNEVHKSTMWS